MNNGKWTVWALGFWFIGGLLLAFFNRPLNDALWVLTAFVYIAYFLVGIILSVICVVNAIRTRNLYSRGSAVGFICSGLLLIFLIPPIASFGERLIVKYRFDSHIAQYQHIVSEANAGRMPSGYGIDESIRFHVDQGPPIRVAFPQPGGTLDNWEGIVYDPTGDVLKAQGWTGPDGKLTAPSDIISLFGGTLVSCIKIDGDYYRCSFT